MATVVFADLVGSTGIFERLGDETAGRFVTQLTTALAKIFEQHHGRVVKLLGDGLFVVFPHEAEAITACIAIQKRLQDKPVYPGGNGRPVQMQMGIESGEVVEIEGDCYGDAVNSAARLADLAGADQILTTQRVCDALSAAAAGRAAQHGPHVPARQGRSHRRLPGRMASRARRRRDHDGRVHVQAAPPRRTCSSAAPGRPCGWAARRARSRWAAPPRPPAP